MTAGTPEWLEHGWEGAEDRGCQLGSGSGAGQGAPDPAQPPPTPDKLGCLPCFLQRRSFPGAQCFQVATEHLSKEHEPKLTHREVPAH